MPIEAMSKEKNLIKNLNRCRKYNKNNGKAEETFELLKNYYKS